MKKSITLFPIQSLNQYLSGGELVAFDVGPDRVIYLVIALNPLDNIIEQPGWASFPKTIPELPQKYRVVGIFEQKCVLDIVIEQEIFNIHYIQPLRDELLLVCARSYYTSPSEIERNGRVYTCKGQFVREILLGDGIESVQSDSQGVIWTSYFDEGIFGNFGWDHPIGIAGLVAWDSAGNKLYEFNPPPGLDSICDCYALNVESEQDAWCYYYTEFPLVHLQNRKIVSYWEIPLGGSHTFAIFNHYALFSGGYGTPGSYQLFSLENQKKAQPVATIEFCDEQGTIFKANKVTGRADTIYFLSNDLLYTIDVQTVLTSIKTRT